jgi:DedD protein
MEDNDAQLQLKKRARRRLVGAVVFASIVAVVLPIIMDHKPRPTVQDVEIRIPGQDEKAFAPKFAIAPIEKPPADAPDSAPAADKAPAAATAPSAPPADKPVEAKVVEKPAEKPVAKPEKPAAKEPADAKRAAAILAGQGATADTPPAKAGEYVILIGAFASEENVKNIKSKLAERNIRTYTEPLDTPGGKRTRVRAGPFPSREAAEKALEKMKQVGVSGVISGR